MLRKHVFPSKCPLSWLVPPSFDARNMRATNHARNILLNRYYIFIFMEVCTFSVMIRIISPANVISGLYNRYRALQSAMPALNSYCSTPADSIYEMQTTLGFRFRNSSVKFIAMIALFSNGNWDYIRGIVCCYSSTSSR